MRTFRLIGMTLLMVMLTVNFTACSDDDEEQQDDKTLALLVGSWENELDSFTDVNGNVVSSTTEVLTFKADMTWTGIDYYTGTNYPNEKTEKWGEGTYSYDSSKKRLTLNNNIFESDIVEILEITESKLSYLSEDGIMNYTRKSKKVNKNQTLGGIDYLCRLCLCAFMN